MGREVVLTKFAMDRAADWDKLPTRLAAPPLAWAKAIIHGSLDNLLRLTLDAIS